MHAARTTLAASNDLSGGAERATSEVGASASGRALWADALPAAVVVIAGSPRFAAFGLADGSLQVRSTLNLHLWVYPALFVLSYGACKCPCMLHQVLLMHNFARMAQP